MGSTLWLRCRRAVLQQKNALGRMPTDPDLFQFPGNAEAIKAAVEKLAEG